MAKAINWPKEFYEEVINEDSLKAKIALRLGTMYYENSYYVKGEIVDIRVDHKITRKAEIVDEMRISKIKDLSEDVLGMYKNSMLQKSEVVNFLAGNYNQPVSEETDVTIITYRNIPWEECDEIDDPHIN